MSISGKVLASLYNIITSRFGSIYLHLLLSDYPQGFHVMSDIVVMLYNVLIAQQLIASIEHEIYCRVQKSI